MECRQRENPFENEVIKRWLLSIKNSQSDSSKHISVSDFSFHFGINNMDKDTDRVADALRGKLFSSFVP